MQITNDRESAPLFVQYGSGPLSDPLGWISFDASPTLLIEKIPVIGRLIRKNGNYFPRNTRYGDIVRGLPLPSSSCAAIYASHVLEHLTLCDARVALANTYSLLRPGGIFRVIVPDLRFIATQYLDSNIAEASLTFMRRSGLGRESSPTGAITFLTQTFGKSQHLWMWDHRALERELRAVGFEEIRPCKFNDSEEPAFLDVEDKLRFQESVAIECVK